MLITVCKTYGQMNIIQYPLQQLQLKPADMFLADVINNDKIMGQIFFIGSIVNSTSGQKVVTARTKIIELPVGLTKLNESVLQPSYTVHSTIATQYENLPFGNYEVCIKAYVVGGIEDLASACQSIEVTPISPPLLLAPENASAIQEKYPLLAWLPPMPIGKDKVLYDLKLVEIQPNQTPYDAIQRNFALLERNNIVGTTLQYPANAMGIEDGKRYAWKIFAKTDKNKPIGETEIWWFEKKPIESQTDLEDIQPNKDFIRLRKGKDMDMSYVRDDIKIIYDERYGECIAELIITAENGKEVLNKKVNLKKGENRILIDFTTEGNIRRNAVYTITVDAPERLPQYLTFKNLK